MKRCWFTSVEFFPKFLMYLTIHLLDWCRFFLLWAIVCGALLLGLTLVAFFFFLIIILHFSVLNETFHHYGKQEDTLKKSGDLNAFDLSKTVNSCILKIYGNFLSEDGLKQALICCLFDSGRYVDYLGMSKSERFKEFLDGVTQLPLVSLIVWKVFFPAILSFPHLSYSLATQNF